MRTSHPSWRQISGSTASQRFWFFSQFRLQSHVGLNGDTSQQRDGRLQLTEHHQRLWRASFAQQLHQARFYKHTSKTQLVSMVTEVHPGSQLSSGTSLTSKMHLCPHNCCLTGYLLILGPSAVNPRDGCGLRSQQQQSATLKVPFLCPHCEAGLIFNKLS